MNTKERPLTFRAFIEQQAMSGDSQYRQAEAQRITDGSGHRSHALFSHSDARALPNMALLYAIYTELQAPPAVHDYMRIMCAAFFKLTNIFVSRDTAKELLRKHHNKSFDEHVHHVHALTEETAAPSEPHEPRSQNRKRYREILDQLRSETAADDANGQLNLVYLEAVRPACVCVACSVVFSFCNRPRGFTTSAPPTSHSWPVLFPRCVSRSAKRRSSDCTQLYETAASINLLRTLATPESSKSIPPP